MQISYGPRQAFGLLPQHREAVTNISDINSGLVSIREEMAELREAIQLWNLGMTEVVDSLKIHGQMLGQILDACSYEPPAEDSPLVALLSQIVAAANNQAEVLAEIAAGVERIEHQRYQV